MTGLLLVEDDTHLLTALSLTLRARGHHVHQATTGAQALELLEHRRIDLVVLDLGLPDMDGIDVLHRIRQSGNPVPVIVLSARDSQTVKVAALDAGADDYLTKPFGLDELLARIRAALRRVAPSPDLTTVRTPDFTIDLAHRLVRDPAGAPIHLTPTEWAILAALARAQGMLVASADLLNEVWGPQYRTQTNYLRVYLAQLRRKLEPDPANPRYLITTPGQGYTLAAAPIASMPGDDPAREASGRPSPPPGQPPPGQPPPGQPPAAPL